MTLAKGNNGSAIGSHLLADDDSLESRRYPSVRRKTGPGCNGA
jgi:hypothetical protein